MNRKLRRSGILVPDLAAVARRHDLLMLAPTPGGGQDSNRNRLPGPYGQVFEMGRWFCMRLDSHVPDRAARFHAAQDAWMSVSKFDKDVLYWDCEDLWCTRRALELVGLRPLTLPLAPSE